MEVAGPLGTPLGLAQRKRASPRGKFILLVPAASLGSLDHCFTFPTRHCSFPGENARSWEALGEARPGQSSLSSGALRYRAH